MLRRHRACACVEGLLFGDSTRLAFIRGSQRPVAPQIESRFVLGMMNGITPALRTTVREICGAEHVVQAMAYIDGRNPHILSRLECTCLPLPNS